MSKNEVKEMNYTAGPEDNVAINSIDPSQVRYVDITEINCDPKLNVRDYANYKNAVERKVQELLRDGAIRVPLVVCRLKSQRPDELPLVTCGFLRSHAMLAIKERNPEFYEAHFKGKIPIILHEGITERERTIMLLDHGSEEQLDQYEVYLSQVRLMRQKGLYSQRAMISMLSRLYYQLASAKDRATYDLLVRELTEKGFVLKGKNLCQDIESVQFLTFRGRFQYFQRIYESAECVAEAFRKYVRGDDGGVNITFKMAEQLHGLSPDAAKKILDVARIGRPITEPKHWTKPVMESALTTCKSDFYTMQLKAALGDIDSQKALPDKEDELIRIEKAMKVDPKRFWEMVEEIILHAPTDAPVSQDEDEDLVPDV